MGDAVASLPHQHRFEVCRLRSLKSKTFLTHRKSILDGEDVNRQKTADVRSDGERLYFGGAAGTQQMAPLGQGGSAALAL